MKPAPKKMMASIDQSMAKQVAFIDATQGKGSAIKNFFAMFVAAVVSQSNTVEEYKKFAEAAATLLLEKDGYVSCMADKDPEGFKKYQSPFEEEPMPLSPHYGIPYYETHNNQIN